MRSAVCFGWLLEQDAVDSTAVLRTPTTLSLLLSVSSAVGCARSSPRFDPASLVDAAAPATPHSTATPEEARQSCRYECEGADECPQLDSFLDYATTRSDWGNSCAGYLFAIAGTCDDG